MVFVLDALEVRVVDQPVIDSFPEPRRINLATKLSFGDLSLAFRVDSGINVVHTFSSLVEWQVLVVNGTNIEVGL
jgi:hypothetical protein